MKDPPAAERGCRTTTAFLRMTVRRPVGVTLLALFVAWQSFGLLSLSLMVAGRHSDHPLYPLPTALGLGASVVGVTLAHRLWRMRSSAPALFVAWVVLALAFAAFWPKLVVPGPGRRGAIVAVAVAIVVLGAGTIAAIRYLRGALARPD